MQSNDQNQYYQQDPYSQNQFAPQNQYPSQGNIYGNYSNYPNNVNGNCVGYGSPCTQSMPVQFNGTQEKSMVFHTIYSIWLLISGILSVLSALGVMLGEDGVAPGMISLLSSAYTITMAIFLLKRMKAGNIMRLINNIMGFISAFVMIGFGILFWAFWEIIVAATDVGAEVSLAGIGAILGISVIVGAIIGTVINILVMIYYKKRKHMFH